MGSITRQSWREKPYQVPANQSFEIDFIDSDPNYVVIYNKSNQQLYVSRYPGASATSYDFTVPPLSNRQWGWDGTLKNLYVFQGGPGVANINLTSYAAAFDPAAVAQSGQNVVVANDLNVASMPAVTIAGGTLNVGTMPTVQANITGGAINATIQNANLNSTVTNAMIGSNPSVLIVNGVQQVVSNLANNTSLNIFPNVIPIPLILADSVSLIIVSSLADPTSLYTVDQITAYNTIPDSNLGNGNVQFISKSNKTANYKIDLAYPFPTNRAMFSITNKSGSTIVSDTLTIYIIIKYASVSNKPVADSMISATGNFNTTTSVMVAGDGTKLLKELHVDFKNTTGSSVIYSVFGGPGHGVQLASPTVAANSSYHEDLYFGNGIPFDDGLWGWSNNAVAQYIGGYAILTNK